MFSKYVSLDTIYRAGFNYYEPSFPIEKDKKFFTVYHTKYYFETEPNLVVIESIKNHNELYFRAFLGKHSGECKTNNEIELFLEEVRKTIAPEFKVKGRNLEKKILKLLNDVDEGLFPN